MRVCQNRSSLVDGKVTANARLHQVIHISLAEVEHGVDKRHLSKSHRIGFFSANPAANTRLTDTPGGIFSSNPYQLDGLMI